MRRGRAFVQQVLDGGSRLAQLGREGVFGCEGYLARSTGSRQCHGWERERTVVKKGDPDGTIVLFLKACKHLKVGHSSRKNISST